MLYTMKKNAIRYSCFSAFLVCRRNFGIPKIMFQQRANNGNSLCTAGKEVIFLCFTGGLILMSCGYQLDAKTGHSFKGSGVRKL